MAYDETVAQRLREAFKNRSGVTERRMFGGLTFLLNGHMCCGVVQGELMVRVGPDAYLRHLHNQAPERWIGTCTTRRQKDGFHGPAHERPRLCRFRGFRIGPEFAGLG